MEMQLQLHVHVQVYLDSLYMKMSLSGRCHIVLIVYCKGRNKQFKGNMAVSKKKIRMTSWLQISEKDEQM